LGWVGLASSGRARARERSKSSIKNNNKLSEGREEKPEFEKNLRPVRQATYARGKPDWHHKADREKRPRKKDGGKKETRKITAMNP